ncbi:MAG TPA: YhbY family RNA-binding protein [Holophagaceae bacterium]|jgi:RNA-binding protein|nr:YhbY family RNA-binding protein [Holophagaceae bacterium]
MAKLTPKQRQFLKAKAHALKPLIQIGKAGATPALVDELDRVLGVHELVKVKLNDNTFEDEAGVVATLTAKVEGLIHVWTIGHTLLLFRPSRERATRYPLP